MPISTSKHTAKVARGAAASCPAEREREREAGGPSFVLHRSIDPLQSSAAAAVGEAHGRFRRGALREGKVVRRQLRLLRQALDGDARRPRDEVCLDPGVHRGAAGSIDGWID